MFPKPSTQALLLCDMYLLTEVNKKTSFSASQADKAETESKNCFFMAGGRSKN